MNDTLINHRPSPDFGADAFASPVASMVETGDGAAVPDGMRFP